MADPTFTVRMITIDCHDPKALATFWSAATGCDVVADHGEFVMVGSTPTLGFQRVQAPTAGKNRIHIDGGNAEGGREQLVSRLLGLGATEHETRTMPGLTWTVMADPEGNVFCVGEPED